MSQPTYSFSSTINIQGLNYQPQYYAYNPYTTSGQNYFSSAVNNASQANAATATTESTATQSAEPVKTNEEKIETSLNKLRGSSARGYSDAVTWRGILGGTETKDLITSLTRNWNTSATEEGVYKMQTAFKESGILAEETIAKHPQNFDTAIKNVASLKASGRISATYADQLTTELQQAKAAYVQLKAAVGQGGKVSEMRTGQVDSIAAAMDKAAAEMKDVNDLMSVDKISEAINLKNKPNWLQEGFGNVGYLGHVTNNAKAVGDTQVSTTSKAFQDAINGFKKGTVSSTQLLSTATAFENALNASSDKTVGEKTGNYDLTGSVKKLISADTTNLSSAERATLLNDVDLEIRTAHNIYASKHATKAREDGNVQKAFGDKAAATQKVIDQIYKKYGDLAGRSYTSNLGELDELLAGVQAIAQRLASGNSTNNDLRAIRALENLIEYRVENPGAETDARARQFVQQLTGGQRLLGLDDIPKNREDAFTQLGMNGGGIDYLIKGLRDDTMSLNHTFDRMNHRGQAYNSYSPITFNPASSFYSPGLGSYKFGFSNMGINNPFSLMNAYNPSGLTSSYGSFNLMNSYSPSAYSYGPSMMQSFNSPLFSMMSSYSPSSPSAYSYGPSMMSSYSPSTYSTPSLFSSTTSLSGPGGFSFSNSFSVAGNPFSFGSSINNPFTFGSYNHMYG